MFVELEDYLFNCRARGLSERTLKGYKNINLAFIRWMSENNSITNVDDVKKIHMQKYVTGMLDNSRKAKYINTIIKTVSGFFNYIFEEEYIDDNPIRKVRLVRPESKPFVVYTDEEAISLMDAFDGTDYLSVRNKMIIALQIDTGIRCTETIQIRLTDIFDDRILIHGKGNKVRNVPLSFQMNKMLKKYLKVKDNFKTSFKQENYLFISRTGRPLTVEAVERCYKRAQEMVGITRPVRVSPHTSRHYFAVKMLENNDIYTVSKLLGHSSVKVTEIYVSSVTSKEIIQKGRINSPLSQLKSKYKN